MTLGVARIKKSKQRSNSAHDLKTTHVYTYTHIHIYTYTHIHIHTSWTNQYSMGLAYGISRVWFLVEFKQ